MSFLKIQLFEALTGQTSPYEGFGPILAGSEARHRAGEVVREALVRCREVFGVAVPSGRECVATLESLVSNMWREGWDPQHGDINLFVRDFGSLFMDAIVAALAGQLVFRSATDLSHCSIWWAHRRIEVFPFHLVYKRLTDANGEPLIHFFDGLAKSVSLPPAMEN